MLTLEKYLAAGETQLSNLLLNNYRKIGMVHEELILYLFLLKAHQEGNDFPSLEKISQAMAEDVAHLYEVMQGLLQKKLIAIETQENQEGRKVDVYNLLPVFTRISELLEQNERQQFHQQKVADIKTLIQQFQQEFGRALSPMELETISMWLEQDHYSPHLVSLALREAVLNNAQSIKYIDRILLSWERKNIKTEEQVQQEKKRHSGQTATQDSKRSNQNQPRNPKNAIPLINWLEPEK